MASQYPTLIDTLPEIVDGKTNLGGTLLNPHRNAIIAVQEELGTNPSTTYGTVRARIDAIEGALLAFGSPDEIKGVLKDGTLVRSRVTELNFQGLPATVTSAVEPGRVDISLSDLDSHIGAVWDGYAVVRTDVNVLNLMGNATVLPGPPGRVDITFPFPTFGVEQDGLLFASAADGLDFIGPHFDLTLDGSVVEVDFLVPTLAEILDEGNTTSGHHLVMSVGDGISSLDPAGVEVLTDLRVAGKLTVTGLIDPTGLVLDEQSGVPGGTPTSGHGTIWLKNDRTLQFTDDAGSTRQVGPADVSLSEVLAFGNTTGATDLVFSAGATLLSAPGSGGSAGAPLEMETGPGDGNGDSGTLSLGTAPLAGASTGSSGAITVQTGDSLSSPGQSGDLLLTTGDAGAGAVAVGDVTAAPGTHHGQGAGGWLNLYGGDGYDGGSVHLLAGSGPLGGGDVHLQPGVAPDGYAGALDGYILLDGPVDAQSHRIESVGAPLEAADAATRGYVDAAVRPGGTTGSRPSAPALYQSYFDTTLGYEIHYNGTNWVDSAGVIV